MSRPGTWTCYHLTAPNSREKLCAMYGRDDIMGYDLYDYMIDGDILESFDRHDVDGGIDYVAIMGKTSVDDDFCWEFTPDESDWETLCRRTEDPKLRFIELVLDRMGIPHRRNGSSFHAPILEVRSGDLDAADSTLTTTLGDIADKRGIAAEELACALGIEVEKITSRYGRDCMFDDVPDDDSAFA